MRQTGCWTYTAPLPEVMRGGWYRLSWKVPAAAQRLGRPGLLSRLGRWIGGGRSLAGMLAAQLDVASVDDPSVYSPLATLLPGRWGTQCRTLTFLPREAKALRLSVFAALTPPDPINLDCERLARPAAAWAIACRHAPSLITALLRGLVTEPRGAATRLRTVFSHLAAREQAPPYALWTRLFDTWSEADHARLLAAPTRGAWPTIATIVMQAAPSGAACTASRAAAARAGGPGSSPITVGPGNATLAEALATITAEYIAVLQAGEILPPHALALLAHHAARLGRPVVLYADEDRISGDGTRHAPLFKPPPSHTLMLSGTLCTGVWLIRREHLAGFSAAAGSWAETLRLDAWLRLQDAGQATASHRVPFVLTHRRPDAEAAPPAALAAVAAAHIARAGLPASISEDRPLRLRLSAPRAAQPRVSIVVPSACRAPHVLRDISATLARTDYADFELIVVVAGSLPLDAGQEAVLTRLTSNPRIRWLVIEADRFNYAIANNRAVATSNSPLICLLNDDVAPRDPGWLAAMVGHLADPAVGVVGARLCYPDRTIQHAGIVLLPDGTGEHLHRFLPCGAPGYGGRAQLSQEVSAVTGACLLTRRALWQRLGGLDESYASAFNDVDYCLRVREAGYGVVLAADAELTHAELVSFGQHYGPDEQARNIADRARLRGRFREAFRADPFHNPNLALRRKDCWSPAFPPRVGRFEGRQPIPTPSEPAEPSTRRKTPAARLDQTTEAGSSRPA